RMYSRSQFFDHVEHYPDVWLANVYAPDRTIIWSTNAQLIGQRIINDDDIEEAFRLKANVFISYHDGDNARAQRKFPVVPDSFFIENYVPLFDVDENKVMVMVEVYKEPKDLII